MPYSFDKIMGQLGQKPDDKADIFGGQAGGGAQSPTYGGSGAEGDLSGSGGDVASAKPQASDVSSSAAYRSNVGKTASPLNLGGLRAGVAAKDKALTDEANAYLKNSYGQDKLSDEDTDQLRGAIDKNYQPKPTGDESGFAYGGGNPSKSGMDYWSSVASGQVDKVNPFKSTLNLQDQNIENLGTDAGVQNLLRRGSGAEYNMGDAAFDQALLSQDQGFQQGRQDLMDSYRGLQNRQNTEADDLTQRGQGAHDFARVQYLADLKNRLGGFKDEYTAAAQQKEKEIEDAAVARQNALLGGAGDVLGQRAQALASDPANAALKDYFSAQGLDPAQFAHGTFDPNAHGWQDYLSDDEALRFNNIMTLLGSKDIYGKGGMAGGYSDSDLANIDTNAMDQALMQNATAARDAAAAPTVAPTSASEPTVGDAGSSVSAQPRSGIAADYYDKLHGTDGILGEGSAKFTKYIGGNQYAQDRARSLGSATPITADKMRTFNPNVDEPAVSVGPEPIHAPNITQAPTPNPIQDLNPVKAIKKIRWR